MAPTLTSGDLARATGETVRTVRFYEEQGLLVPAQVSDGGHRRFEPEALERLQLILDLRELGLSIPDIRAMLATREGCRTASDFRKVLRERLPAHISRARERLERLRRLEGELRQALRSVTDDGDAPNAPCPCTVAETHGAPRIVRVLARTGTCLAKHPAEKGAGDASRDLVSGPRSSRFHA